ncbi:MAG: ferredoxin [Dehalococcoidia bacterium]|nr:ferredoxin [Dehalococcoidia bacterium]
MKRVVVDRVICLKAGQCYYLQPSIFKADPQGWPDILVEFPESDDDIEAAEDAAEICPSGAIVVEDA